MNTYYVYTANFTILWADNDCSLPLMYASTSSFLNISANFNFDYVGWSATSLWLDQSTARAISIRSCFPLYIYLLIYPHINVQHDTLVFHMSNTRLRSIELDRDGSSAEWTYGYYDRRGERTFEFRHPGQHKRFGWSSRCGRCSSGGWQPASPKELVATYWRSFSNRSQQNRTTKPSQRYASASWHWTTFQLCLRSRPIWHACLYNASHEEIRQESHLLLQRRHIRRLATRLPRLHRGR